MAALGASVPEAPVDEYGDALSFEEEVGRARNLIRAESPTGNSISDKVRSRRSSVVALERDLIARMLRLQLGVVLKRYSMTRPHLRMNRPDLQFVPVPSGYQPCR